jgi:hypothetical protein
MGWAIQSKSSANASRYGGRRFGLAASASRNILPIYAYGTAVDAIDLNAVWWLAGHKGAAL